MSPVDDLRTASAEVRKYWGVPIAEPVADLLDFEADLIARVPGSEMQERTRLVLAVGRVITKGAEADPRSPHHDHRLRSGRDGRAPGSREADVHAQRGPGAPAMSAPVVARYYRLHILHEVPCDSVDEAIGFLAARLDDGDCAIKDVVSPDGVTALDESATSLRATARMWGRDANEAPVRPDEEGT